MPKVKYKVIQCQTILYFFKEESLILGIGYKPLLLTAFSFAFLFFFAFDASSGFASLSEISFPVKENSGSSSPKAISLADAFENVKK